LRVNSILRSNRRSQATGRQRIFRHSVARFGWLGCLAVVAACASSGHLAPIAPGISGVIRGDAIAEASAELILRIFHRESASLVGQVQTRVEPDGSFILDPVKRLVSRHESSRDYRALLYLRVAGENRVVWRVRYSRTALTESVELDCDLARSERIGQPCLIDDPQEQRWFAREGEQTYRRLCVGCHGIDGRGKIGTDAEERPRPPDLRTFALRRGGEFNRTEIATWIEGRSSPVAHGPRDMPIWGEDLQLEYRQYANPDALIGATLDPLVAYLEMLQEEE
jgi:mono/diheme cytochrome c family protein